MSSSFLLLVLSMLLFGASLFVGFIGAIVVCVRSRQELRGAGRYIIPLAASSAVLLLIAVLPTAGEHPWRLLLVIPRFLQAALYGGAGLVLALRQGLNSPLKKSGWLGR